MQALSGGGRVAGFLAALAAAAIWGGTYVVSRAVLDVVPPATLVVVRMLLSCLILLAFLRLLRRPLIPPRSAWPALIITGLVGNALSITAQFQGTALAGAAVGSVVTTASPVVTVALAVLTGREKVHPLSWVGLALSVVGVWVLSAPGGADPAGVAWLVLAAVSWGVLGHVGGGAAREHDAALVTAWASLVAVLALLPLSAFEVASGRVGLIGAGEVAGVLYLGIVATAAAFALWVYGVSRAGSVASGLAFFAQPLIGGVLGATLLKESLGGGFLTGAVLIVLGGFVAGRSVSASGPRASRPAPQPD